MADLQASDKGFDSATGSPPPLSSGSFGGELSSLAQKLEQSSAETTKRLDETRPAKMALLDRLASEKMPTPPEIAPPEKPPVAAPETSPLEKFGSVASALAIFGSLLSRRPLTTALNASASAMNAIKQNDAEAYKRHFDEWKQQSEYAGQVAEWQANRYRDAMDQYKGNHDGLMAQLQTIAALDQDTTMQHTIRTGDLGLVEKVLDDRYRMVKDYKDYQLRLDEFGERKRVDLDNAAYHLAMAARPTGRSSGELQALTEVVKRKEAELGRPLTAEEYVETQRDASIAYQNAARHDDTTRRGQDLRFNAATAATEVRKELGEKADLRNTKAIEGTQWYREQMVGLRELGLTEAGSKREMEERVAKMRDDTSRRGQDLTHGVSEERVQNDKLYKDAVLKLRERGLSDGEAKEKALEEYRDRALSVRKELSGAKQQKAVQQTDSLLHQADDLLALIDKNPNVVGTRGKIGGAYETVKGLINPRAAVDPDFQKFETAMKAFRTEASLAISQSKYYSGARMAEMAKTLPALENFTSAQDASAALATMKGLLEGARLEVGEASKSSLGTITQADLETTARENGMPVDAVKRMLREKGFDVP